MDSAQKYIRKRIKELVDEEYTIKDISPSIWISDDQIVVFDGYLCMSPKNEQLVRDELERVRKIVDSPLYQVLNSVDKPKKP